MICGFVTGNGKSLADAMSEYLSAQEDTTFTMTDPDDFQLRRKVKPGVYELYQVSAVQPWISEEEKAFSISHEIVYLSDLDDDDIRSILDCYGYGSLLEFQTEFKEREEWQDLLAEMSFELNAGSLENLISPALSYDECVERIKEMSGYVDSD